MTSLRKLALAMVIPAAGSLVFLGAGTANAAGDLYGAIAVTTMRVGAAADYPVQHEADQAALDACGESVCHIVARIHNACGSVVERDGKTPFGGAMPFYFTGTGATAAEAEADALRIAGPDVGTPLLEITKPAFVLDTICTANAG
ncbi:DUF4189 domain-containing protein [Nocardia sp. NPDC050406]|uniref:DUF4189 domain-containing protein n=1 Tax=Nocardia sp. NPDC050406 TaxID=3364318 RepID=UPI0037AEB99A